MRTASGPRAPVTVPCLLWWGGGEAGFRGWWGELCRAATIFAGCCSSADAGLLPCFPAAAGWQPTNTGTRFISPTSWVSACLRGALHRAGPESRKSGPVALARLPPHQYASGKKGIGCTCWGQTLHQAGKEMGWGVGSEREPITREPSLLYRD